MDNDDRQRRDWPESDQPADETEGPRTDPAAEAPEPEASDPQASEPTASAAEIESWPSQEATRDPDPVSEPEPTTEPMTAREPEPAWPTEPPAAGSASEESWPTSPPERGDDPILEPSRDVAEPPPGEVEAYPASDRTTPGVDAAAAAGTAAHSVPAAESSTSESTQCPRCGAENRAGLAFCRSCGQRLVAAGVASTVERPGTPEGTMACPRCGTHNRAGVAFCQNCGANLRGTAPGYVPPSVAPEPGVVAATDARRGAVLGPVVLLIGLIGLITGYLLPFIGASSSLLDRAYGADGYGIAFWNGYSDVNPALADQAYFGLAAPAPLLGLLLVVLAIAGFMRAAPGLMQTIGLVVALLWSVGLSAAFVLVELVGNWDGDMVGLLRVLTPAGIIFFLSSLIILIGTLTRFGRS